MTGAVCPKCLKGVGKQLLPAWMFSPVGSHTSIPICLHFEIKLFLLSMLLVTVFPGKNDFQTAK
jgi:ribosome-associated toxin RatA of RatAB toxin-antitoxin module